MGFYIPNGSTVDVQGGVAASVNITALSNASEAVATATNTLANGDYVVITSGWSRLNGRVVRVKAVSGTTFTLEGVDTTNTTIFPALAGTGSFAKVTSWTQISQVTDMEFSGGEQNFNEFQFLDEDYQRSVPTFKTAIKGKFEVADDPSLPWYPVVSTANDDRVARAVKVNMTNGSKLLMPAIVTMTSIPKLKVNEVATQEINLSLVAQPTRYAS